MIPEKNSTKLRAKPWHYHPSAFLLAAQIIQMILYAVIDDSHDGRVVIGAFGILVLTLVVWVVIKSPAVSWVALALANPVRVLPMLERFTGVGYVAVVMSRLIGLTTSLQKK